MQQNIGQVRCGCAGPKQSGVQHERYPGERVPIRVLTTDKSPVDVGPRQTGQDPGIAGEITRVVVAQKTIIADRKIDGECRQGQEQANKARTAKRAKLAGLMIHDKMKTNRPFDDQKKAA